MAALENAVCPSCGASKLESPTIWGIVCGPAVLRCQCQPDCCMARCLVCHFEGHAMEFEAMAKIPVTPASEEPSHPTQARTSLFPDDDKLRAADFRLTMYGRPVGRQSIWERFIAGKWVEYTQTEALAILRDTKVAAGGKRVKSKAG